MFTNFTTLADGADGRNRTGDLRITNALLYQLSYIGLERVMGIEPTLSAWEAEVLPLNYTRQGVGTICRDLTEAGSIAEITFFRERFHSADLLILARLTPSLKHRPFYVKSLEHRFVRKILRFDRFVSIP